MKVAVTGHMGFVGSHLVRALKEDSHQVVGFDKREAYSMGELADFHISKFTMKQPDVIVHLASSCSTLGSILQPEQTFRDTVMTTVTVCKAAAKMRVPLILTSSVKARDGMTPYGAAKRMSETWANEMAATFGFPIVTNRPGTIYGPGQEGSVESGWIAWFLKAKHERREVVINGDGSQQRDLLHVSDYVRLLMAQVKSPLLYAGRTWDVGGGVNNVVTVKQIADHLGLAYQFGPERYGDADSYIGVNAAPDWEPEVYWRDAEVFQP